GSHRAPSPDQGGGSPGGDPRSSEGPDRRGTPGWRPRPAARLESSVVTDVPSRASRRPQPMPLLRPIVVVAAAALMLPAAAVQAADRPNVVFILADDLGINDLGCYGREEHSTPRLDDLAARGARFTSAYCGMSICSASRAALMTGKS